MNFLYPFNWDSTVIAITVLSVLIILSLILFLFKKKRYILASLSIAGFVFILAFIPHQTEITSKRITIRHLGWKTIIFTNEIISVRAILSDEITKSIRVFGSGGLGGYLGYFKNPHIGKYILWATEKHNLILIETQNQKYVISSIPSKELPHIENLIKRIV